MKYPHVYTIFRGLADIPPEAWRSFEALLHPRTIGKGDCFVRAGDRHHEIGIILSGLVKIYAIDLKGREFIKAFRKENELAAAYADLLEGRPARQTIEALEETFLLAFPYERFCALYDEHPCWQVAARKIAEEHYVKKNRREFEFMQLSADSRYEAFLEAHADLLPRLSQYHIAAYLGITPVALSRIRRRRRMRRKGSG